MILFILPRLSPSNHWEGQASTFCPSLQLSFGFLGRGVFVLVRVPARESKKTSFFPPGYLMVVDYRSFWVCPKQGLSKRRQRRSRNFTEQVCAMVERISKAHLARRFQKKVLSIGGLDCSIIIVKSRILGSHIGRFPRTVFGFCAGPQTQTGTRG